MWVGQPGPDARAAGSGVASFPRGAYDDYMTEIVSLRLKDEQVARLQRAARQLGKTPTEVATLLLEESLRQREFAFIEFRDSTVGRQAFLQGTRLPIWQLAWLLRDYDGDQARMA